MEQIQVTNDYATSNNNLNYLINPKFINVKRLFEV